MCDVDYGRVKSRVGLAYHLAKVAHKGQVDKGGNPYISHPVTVAGMVDSEEEKIVALLHDVIEDTDVSIDIIQSMFGDRVAEAVMLLTRNKAVPYESYVRLIKGNELARKVKLADLKHNMDLTRIPNPKDEDMDRLVYKYFPAYIYLNS